jgi:DNA-binding SARP family transcriptional activator
MVLSAVPSSAPGLALRPDPPAISLEAATSPTVVTPATAGRQSRVKTRVSLCLFETFGLYRDGRDIPMATGPQRLLALLALSEGSMARSVVAGTLWPDKTEERAAANLRSTLWRLRQPGVPLVVCKGNSLRLAESVDVDVDRQRSFCRRVNAHAVTLAEIDGFDLNDLLGGDLLPDWYDDWVLVVRERVRQMRLHAADMLCRLLTEAGRFSDAIDLGLGSITAEPYRESAHRALIEVHLAEGNRSEAIRQFRRYCGLIRDELDIEPSRELRSLVGDLS